MYYPLTLNWDKISCLCSSIMLGWSLYINCSKNNTLTKLSILNHIRTRTEDPIYLGIKSYLEALYGINDIDESTCTEQENQSILGIDPSWAQKTSHNEQGWIMNSKPDTTCAQ